MKAEMTEIVMPSDANHIGTCFGGRIMSWIDMVAAIAAQRYVGSVVTASVDSIEFKEPIRIGDVVTLKASVNNIWNTSMEVGVKVEVQRPISAGDFGPVEESIEYHQYSKLSEPKQACRAYLTFVSVDIKGNRRKPVVPEDKTDDLTLFEEEEMLRRRKEANERRRIRLENSRKEQ